MEQRYLLPSPLDVLENLAKKEGRDSSPRYPS